MTNKKTDTPLQFSPEMEMFHIIKELVFGNDEHNFPEVELKMPRLPMPTETLYGELEEVFEKAKEELHCSSLNTATVRKMRSLLHEIIEHRWHILRAGTSIDDNQMRERIHKAIQGTAAEVKTKEDCETCGNHPKSFTVLYRV